VIAGVRKLRRSNYVHPHTDPVVRLFLAWVAVNVVALLAIENEEAS
jgi:hypothetical protein